MKRERRTMLLLVDSTGSVIGGIRTGSITGTGPSTGIMPLPGQTIQEVEVPEEISQLEAADEIFSAFSNYVVLPAQAKLVRRDLPS
jgi:hypothetical protein